jgi:hypothetical protein
LTEVDCELKGIGSGPSPPTYPPANSFKEVEDFTELAGAKALAEAARAATVNKNLAMVNEVPRKDVLQFFAVVIIRYDFSRDLHAYVFLVPALRTPKDMCST